MRAFEIAYLAWSFGGRAKGLYGSDEQRREMKISPNVVKDECTNEMEMEKSIYQPLLNAIFPTNPLLHKSRF